MLFASTKKINKKKNTRFSIWRRFIYGKVSCVIVWPGERADNSNIAFKKCGDYSTR